MKKATGIALAALLAAGAAFAEDAYLAGNGYQAIDLGRHVGPATRIELDFQLLKTTVSRYILGSVDSGSSVSNLFVNFYANSVGKFSWSYQDDESNYTTTDVSVDTERHTVVLDAYQGKVSLSGGGVSFSANMKTTRTMTSGNTLAVFARHSGTGPDSKFYNPITGRIYGCRIYEAGELVADYVPALSGDQVGLYDTVGGGFYGNVMMPTKNGDLTYGGDILRVPPSDPYVEGTGLSGQFVNTGYLFDGARDRVEVDAEVMDPTMKSKCLFGTVSGGFTAYYWLNSNGSMEFAVGDAVKYYSFYGLGFRADRRRLTYGIDASAKGMGIGAGGYVFATVAATNSLTKKTKYPFSLFAACKCADGITTTTALTPTRIYSMKAYDGVSGTLKHDFRPCVKGNVVGFRDAVTGRFVTDEAKTQANRLTCGGNVEKIADEPFIESFRSASHFIDTGYCPKANTRVVVDFALMEPAVKAYLFGNNSDGVNIALYASNTNYYYYADWKNSGSGKGLGFSTSFARRTFDVDGTGSCCLMTAGYTNTVKSFAALSGESTNSLPIFVRRKSGKTLEYYSSARLYSFKIYEGDALVRDFEPYVKEGLVGLRDTVTGTFKASAGKKVSFGAGGNIPGDGSQEGAYLSSSRRQGINTGYKASDKSRIEIDFALNSHTNGAQRMFGYTSGRSDGAEYQVCGLYSSGSTAGSGNLKFLYGWNQTTYVGGVDTKIATDLRRHTAILDMKNKRTVFTTGTTTNVTENINVNSLLETAQPLGLFGNVKSSGTDIENLTDMRVYSFKIWHDDVLIHHYLPYSGPEGVGMLDVVTGEVKTDFLSSGVPFTVGGCGWGADKAAFYTQPRGGSLSKGDADKTLTAFAPGAIGYQWYKNGVAIKDATNRTYAVAWHKKGMGESYVVKAKFDCFGTEVEQASDAAIVDCRPSGMFLIVK